MGLKPVKVSQLNSYIKRILQTDPVLGNVSVIGEISNLKFHGSGHVYFSLKDETSRINCFLASGNLAGLSCQLEDGMEVTASGYIYLYERGGSYSLNVRDIETAGQGELAVAFQRLKSKLEQEGIFDKKHKKALPAFPRKVAIVTSETGAAVRDIMKIIRQKNDCVDLLLYPVLVQGPNAAGEISAAIDDLNQNHPDVDVIITGRGGGSMEELWAFNEEIVARSIYASDIPIISAVGHETDVTIADFAADLRAETPTAAAERAVPDTHLLRDHVRSIRDEMNRNLRITLEDKKKHLKMLDPEPCGKDIQAQIVLEQMKIDHMLHRMQDTLRACTETRQHRLQALKGILDSCNPKNILAKGYAVVTDGSGAVIKDISTLKINELVTIEAAKGSANARVTSVREETYHDRKEEQL